MPKRNLELDVDDITMLLKTLKALAKQGMEAQKFAQERGLDLPREVQQTIGKVLVLYKKISRENKKVEVAELESIFALEFEGSTSDLN